MVLDLNLATDDLEFTRCWYLRSGQHLKVWVLMEGPKGLAMKAQPTNIYKSPCVGLKGDLAKVSQEPLRAQPVSLTLVERCKGSSEPWSCCASGEHMLGDDESSCWQVAECQVPALLQDGVLSGNLSPCVHQREPFGGNEGFSKGRTKSLAPWKEQEVGFPTEGNGDVNKPLCVISDEDLIMESPKNQPEDAEWANQEVCSEEGNSGHGSPTRGLWVVEHLSDSSFRKFLIFSKFLGLPMDGNEKEIASLLRKMENRKGRRVSVVKRRPSSTPHFVRELRNLECSVNYCNSSKKERSWSSGWEMLCK
ncbi:hypothetical protein CK203_054916 [Vitis vinifera]|uniref:Uncharacterized protein n=1 Tax=Vitis vinifera TaxID=29760 RepID=A0A438GJ77_VITVI|nr:hypothetical protein CK203_054916 [Vitis vinifera]